MYDLKDVADEVREKIDITPVSRVEDVLYAAGILPVTGNA